MSRGDGPTSYFVGEPGFLAALEWAPLSTYTRDGGSRFAKPTKDIVFHLNKRDWGCLNLTKKGEHSCEISSQWGFEPAREQDRHGNWQTANDLKKPWEVRLTIDEPTRALINAQQEAFVRCFDETYPEKGLNFRNLIGDDDQIRVKLPLKTGGPTPPLRDITVLQKFSENSRFGWNSYDFKSPSHFFNIETSSAEYEDLKNLSAQALREKKCALPLLPALSFYAFINQKEYGLVACMRDLLVIWPDGEIESNTWAPPRPKLPLNGAAK